eukprot:10684432-Karenia_brevis.AAC.1
MARNLAAWPTTEELYGRLEKKETRSETGKPMRPRHSFAWIDGQRRCQKCLYRPRVAGRGVAD